MAEPEKKPEQQPQQPQQQATGGTPAAEMDPETKAVWDNFDKAKAEKIAAIKKTFEDKESVKLGERGRSEFREMMKNEVDTIEKLYKQSKDEYVKRISQDQLGKLAAEVGKGKHEEIATKLLEEAAKQADAHISGIESVMTGAFKLKEGEYISEEQIAQLKPMLEGIKKISESEKGKQIQAILEKMRTPNAQLEDQDYDLVIGMLNPHDLEQEVADKNKTQKPEEKFDASSCGFLIALMNPAQRFHLVERLMNSPDRQKQSQTVAVIDGLLRTGILTSPQGKQLFSEAAMKTDASGQPLLSQVDAQKYQDKIDTGVYQKEAEAVKKMLQDRTTQLQGSFSTNFLERSFGAPMLGMGMMIHSIFWMITNVLASGGDLKSLIKNPYFLAAIGEAGLGTEIATGSFTHGGAKNFGIGSGALTGLIEKWTGKDAAENTPEQRADAFIIDTYLNYPDFGSYLENGGAGTILSLREAKVTKATKTTGPSPAAEGQQPAPTSGETKEEKPEEKKVKPEELLISFDDLLTAEKNPEQKSRLQKAQDHFPQKTVPQINGMAEMLANVLHLKNTPEDMKSFMDKLNDIKKSQGLKVPESTPEPPSSQPKPTAPAAPASTPKKAPDLTTS